MPDILEDVTNSSSEHVGVSLYPINVQFAELACGTLAALGTCAVGGKLGGSVFRVPVRRDPNVQIGALPSQLRHTLHIQLRKTMMAAVLEQRRIWSR